MSSIKKYIRIVELAMTPDEHWDDDDEPDLFAYGVWYRLPSMQRNENDLAFQCSAEDEEHAREQCLDAEPGAVITRIERLEEY